MFYSVVEMGVHIKRIYTYFKNDILICIINIISYIKIRLQNVILIHFILDNVWVILLIKYNCIKLYFKTKNEY